MVAIPSRSRTSHQVFGERELVARRIRRVEPDQRLKPLDRLRLDRGPVSFQAASRCFGREDRTTSSRPSGATRAASSSAVSRCPSAHSSPIIHGPARDSDTSRVEARDERFVDQRLQLPGAQVPRRVVARIEVDERVGGAILEVRRPASACRRTGRAARSSSALSPYASTRRSASRSSGGGSAAPRTRRAAGTRRRSPAELRVAQQPPASCMRWSNSIAYASVTELSPSHRYSNG